VFHIEPADSLLGKWAFVSIKTDREDPQSKGVVATNQTLNRPTSNRNIETGLLSTNAQDFTRSLLEAGLLEVGGVAGVYHRSFEFENIIRGIETYVSSAGGNEKRRQLFCSPVMARSTLEKCGYLTSFPDLVGTISSFAGSEADLPMLRERVENGGDWADLLTPTQVALCSAACQNVYPMLVGKPIPPQGLVYEVQAHCFRHEPSDDLARMLSFRQHEFVYIGTAHDAREHAELLRSRFCDLLDGLEISYEVVAANDPFFGRMGRLLAESQRQKSLKYEFVAPITSEVPHSIGSANFHEDHFGASFGLSMFDGSVAHSSCVGFGLERVALALLFRHGTNTANWPTEIQKRLSLTLVKSLPESIERSNT
jgi:seryl-tRNA synthetase